MTTLYLRDRLDRLLFMAEKGTDGVIREQVAVLLDTIPTTLPEIQKDILTLGKPRIRDLMGRSKPYRKDKYIRQLIVSNLRHDLFGQICDVIYKIVNNSEVDDKIDEVTESY